MHLSSALIHALPVGERRVYSRKEAASYVCVSPGKFDKLVAEGRLPAPLPMPGVKRWDKSALDEALNLMSNLRPETIAGSRSAYDAWRSTRGQG